MVLAVVASAILWIYLTPLYFISGGTYPEKGGFIGAMEVVKGGGTPDYILGAIPFFLILMLVELILVIASKLECVGGRYAIDDAWSSLAPRGIARRPRVGRAAHAHQRRIHRGNRDGHGGVASGGDDGGQTCHTTASHGEKRYWYFMRAGNS